MRRRLPSLNALRAFEAAGRLGGMTAAAEELHVTHGAVSRQVRHLEEVLGIKLFEGAKNRLALTEAGRTLLPTLTTSLDQIAAAVSVIADADEGPLDISCLGTLTMRWLIPRLHRFNSSHPGIEVRLSASFAPVDFSRQSFDVAIRVGSGPWPQDAEVTPFIEERFGPVLTVQLMRQRRIQDIDDLGRVPLLHTKTRPAAWREWLRRADAVLDTGSGTEFERYYFMLEAASAGLGACIAPWPLVMDDLRAGRLVAPFGFIASGLQYVALRRRQRSRKAASFCQWIKSEGEATPLPD